MKLKETFKNTDKKTSKKKLSCLERIIAIIIALIFGVIIGFLNYKSLFLQTYNRGMSLSGGIGAGSVFAVGIFFIARKTFLKD